jgi:hypothetical protein
MVLRVLRAAVLTVLGLAAVGLTAGRVAAQEVSVRARAINPGEVLMVTVEGNGPVSARVFDREWPAYAVGPTSWRVLVGIDLDTKPGRYDMVVHVGDGVRHRTLLVQSRAFPTRRLRVNPDLVHPPPEMEARVVREANHLRELWDHTAPERLWTGAFVRPVPDPANSAFGTRSIYNGEPRPPHSGADFLSPAGRPIKAPNSGRVVLAESQYFSGNTVIIDHGLGLFSMVAHLSEIDVAVGDRVEKGQVVGKVGATGRVTGPHLHWTVRLNNARVDPLSLLYATGTASAAGRAQR